MYPFYFSAQVKLYSPFQKGNLHNRWLFFMPITTYKWPLTFLCSFIAWSISSTFHVCWLKFFMMSEIIVLASGKECSLAYKWWLQNHLSKKWMRHEVLDSFILSIIEERNLPQCKKNTKTTKKKNHKKWICGYSK